MAVLGQTHPLLNNVLGRCRQQLRNHVGCGLHKVDIDVMHLAHTLRAQDTTIYDLLRSIHRTATHQLVQHESIWY